MIRVKGKSLEKDDGESAYIDRGLLGNEGNIQCLNQLHFSVHF